MHKVIVIGLTGHTRQYRLNEEAYEALNRYLDHARSRLGDDPDGAEVIGDLERSIGDRLADLAGPDDRVLEAAEVGRVLEEVGAVDAAPDAPTTDARERPAGRRRLYRIRNGQEIAGVCNGLAAYADLDVTLVRWIFVLLGLVTVGLFLLVYLVAMFVLPVVATREDWVAGQVLGDESQRG